MAGREWTLTTDNPEPINQGVVTQDVGGSWSAKTISFRMVAHMRADESIADQAGVYRLTLAEWDNITVIVNRQLVFLTLVPEGAIDHLSFWYQESATFDADNPATKCTAIVQGFGLGQSLITVVEDDDTDVMTFGPKSVVVIDPIDDTEPELRENASISSGGDVYCKSWAKAILNSVVGFFIEVGVSTTKAGAKRLLHWAKYSVLVKVVETLSGDDILIKQFTGAVNNSNYYHSKYKNRKRQPFFAILVSSETDEAFE
jgi:hypothetical protein